MLRPRSGSFQQRPACATDNDSQPPNRRLQLEPPATRPAATGEGPPGAGYRCRPAGPGAGGGPTVGVGAGAFHLPALGVALATFLAVKMSHVRLQALLLITLLLTGLTMIVVTPFFVLDAMVLRAAIAPETRAAFDRAVGNSLLLQTLLIAATLYLGVQLRRIGKRRKSASAVTTASLRTIAE